MHLLNTWRNLMSNPFNTIEDRSDYTEDLSRTELYNYLYTNKIDPIDILLDLLNGYNQTYLIFDDVRS